MAKIRCCKCGSENLRGESSFITCEDCGNVTYLIPQEAVLSFDNPIAADNVNSTITVRFDRTKLDNPRRSICVNDDCGRPCNVIRCKAIDLARRVQDATDEWERFIEKNGEFVCDHMLDENFFPADDDEDDLDDLIPFDDDDENEDDGEELEGDTWAGDEEDEPKEKAKKNPFKEKDKKKKKKD